MSDKLKKKQHNYLLQPRFVTEHQYDSNMRQIFRFLLFSALIISVASCTERVEDCLDINATNFRPDADKACEGCCVYPELEIETSQIFKRIGLDTNSFRADSVFVTSENDTFQLNEARFLFSDIKPYKGQELFETNDTIFIGVEGEPSQVLFVDDFTSITTDGFTFTVGEFRETGLFDGVEIRWGPGDADVVVPDSLYGNSHALAHGQDSTWNSTDGYFHFYLDINEEPGNDDSQRIILVSGPGFDQILNITGQFESETGFNVTIKLEIDYFVLLSGVNFENQTDLQIRETIKSNLPGSLSVQ